MNIYYHPGDADEIQAILRDGFIDNVKHPSMKGPFPQ
jgi:hypothetical protein